MLTARAIENMIEFYGPLLHDVTHTLKVYAYARTIGLREGLPPETQLRLELAAVYHDIACPLCREKYGHADGRHQEEEGPAIAARLLADIACPPETAARVCALVGRHHTVEGVDGADWRILLEADYLVNADEAGYSHEHIRRTEEQVFRTVAGKRLLRTLYPAAWEDAAVV